MPSRAIGAFTLVAIDQKTNDLLVSGTHSPALGAGHEVVVAVVDVNDPLRRVQKRLDSAGTDPWDDVIPNAPADPANETQTFAPFKPTEEVYIVGASRSTSFPDLFVWGEKQTLEVIAQARKPIPDPGIEDDQIPADLDPVILDPQ